MTDNAYKDTFVCTCIDAAMLPFYLPVHVHFKTIIEVYDLEIYEIECNKMGKK